MSHKKLVIFFSIFLLASFLCGCKNDTDDIASFLEINIPKYTSIYQDSSEDGFLGDGFSYASISFDEEHVKQLINEIEKNDSWRKFPLSDQLATFIYGYEDETEVIESVVKADVEDFPNIDNGYWFFKDNNNKNGDPYNDTHLFNRNSFNCMIGILDTDTNILYFYNLDT